MQSPDRHALVKTSVDSLAGSRRGTDSPETQDTDQLGSCWREGRRRVLATSPQPPPVSGGRGRALTGSQVELRISDGPPALWEGPMSVTNLQGPGLSANKGAIAHASTNPAYCGPFCGVSGLRRFSHCRGTPWVERLSHQLALLPNPFYNIPRQA